MNTEQNKENPDMKLKKRGVTRLIFEVLKIQFLSKNQFHIIFNLLLLNQTFSMIARNQLYNMVCITALIIISSNI